MTRSPSKQAKANAASLSEYLRESTGEKIWVEPRVVWVGPGALRIEGRPGAYVWFLNRMGIYADELAKSAVRPVNTVQKIDDALRRAVSAESKVRVTNG